MLQGATVALVPGDPARVEPIAAAMDRHEFLASHREFTSFLGWVDDTPVVVCSTGIGGPSVSIAVEELAQLGVRTFLRVGTTGGIQPHLALGDVIVTTGAVRLDGASLHFAPMEYPAVADFACATALVQAARSIGIDPHVGITASSDTFYPGQERYDTYSGRGHPAVPGKSRRVAGDGGAQLRDGGRHAVHDVFLVGLRAGCVAGVLVNRTQTETPSEETAKQIESTSVAVAVEAARRLVT